MNYLLRIEFLSDTTFAGGEGVAGLIDTEVEYDPETGLPIVRGRTLLGLLVEECANLLYALRASGSSTYAEAEAAARRLFGQPGSTIDSRGSLFVGNAHAPTELVDAVRHAIVDQRLSPEEVLDGLTTIRRQTAIGPNGAPDASSLRSERAVLRTTVLEADVEVESPRELDAALLSACVRAVRRGGLGRNRGRGRLKCRLLERPNGEETPWFALLTGLCR